MVAQSQSELRTHLREQIEFLRSSTQKFDEGQSAYAKQSSIALRVLLHDTSQSRSLLGLLGLKTKLRFMDSAGQLLENNLANTSNLVFSRMTVTGASGDAQLTYEPVLDDFQHRTRLNRPTAFGIAHEPAAGRALLFEDWWNMPVIRDSARADFSRKDLVLSLCNKDGGGHIDPEIDESYARLTRSNSLGMFAGVSGAMQPFGNPVLGSVRQIAHEVLRSLPRSYG